MSERRSERNVKKTVDYKALNEGEYVCDDGDPTLSTPGSTTCEVDDTLKLSPGGGEKSTLFARISELEEAERRLREESELEILRLKVRERERRIERIEMEIHRERERREHVDREMSRVDGKQRQDSDNEAERDRNDRSGKDRPKIDINSLRKMAPLRRKASKELKKLGLVEISESETETGESSESDTNLQDSSSDESPKSNKRYIKLKKNRKIKSGITAKSSDTVINRQRYPHAQLRFDYVSKNISYDKLEMNLFVAGELEIISSSRIKKGEKKARISLLKKLMYLSTTYEFVTVKSLYAAIVREIELGHIKWGDDYQYVESAILSRNKEKGGLSHNSEKMQLRPKPSYEHPTRANTHLAEAPKLFFCAKYQRNKCEFKASHSMVVNGKSKWAKHVCASCWLKDKKELAHPECSSACPHASI